MREVAVLPAGALPPGQPRQRPHQRDVERADREVEARALGLRHVREPACRRDRPCERRQLAEQQLEERRLPAGVRAEHREPLAALEVEADAAEDGRAAVPGGDAFDEQEPAVHRAATLQRTRPPVSPSAIASALAASMPR